MGAGRSAKPRPEELKPRPSEAAGRSLRGFETLQPATGAGGDAAEIRRLDFSSRRDRTRATSGLVKKPPAACRVGGGEGERDTRRPSPEIRW
ncbi:unnamed protein product [Merluccius merluccius]